MERSFSIPAERDGQRLDRALEGLVPGVGLRGRRRLCETGRVLLNGRTAAPGVRVRAGQEIHLLDAEDGDASFGLTVVVRGTDYAALSKPAGVHSAFLAGGEGLSAEAELSALFPDEPAARAPLLCNRLDRETSGLLLVAFGEEALLSFRRAEDAAKARKTYLAVVRSASGEAPPQRMTLSWPLDTDNRRRTRVLGGGEACDPLRSTEIMPLCPAGEGLWLVAARIWKGARHQIRAHLAHAGLPILGDNLYGAGEKEGSGMLHLHHFQLEIPGFEAETPPPWPLWERLKTEASSGLAAL